MFSGSARQIATVLTAQNNASGDLRDVERAGDDAAEAMEGTEQQARTLRNSFFAAAAATTALAGSLTLLVRQHGETEQRFARLQTVTGATDQELSQLRETAMTLGRDLPIAMGDAADAMENLAFAGFSAKEAMSAAEGVANLSVASTMDMAQAARTAGSTLRMFNLEANEMAQVTGTMAATVATSNTRINELSASLVRVGAVASTAGVSLQETSAAIGVLADQGIRAQRAGTALNTTLTRLMGGSSQAQGALDELGVEMDDLTDQSGEFRDLNDVIRVLADGFEDLEGQAERVRVATELAGRRGQRALLPLLESQEELNEKMGEIFRSEIKESIGALNNLDAEQIEGVEEALDMDIDPSQVTPREIVDRMQQLREEGESTEDVAARLQAGLNISGEAAETFARDLDDASVSSDDLAESIGGATTAADIAASQMDTTSGAVEFMRSSFDAMTFTIFKGAGPAIQWFNERLAGAINLLNQNEGAMMAVGSALAVLTGAAGLATAAFAAMWVQLQLANLAQAGLVTQTSAGTAAMWAWTTAARAKNAALWLMTASTGQLMTAISAKTASLWASITAMYASATAATAGSGALGLLSAGFGAATAGAYALWTALGPIGWAVLAVAGAIAILVGLIKTDFLGAGDAAAGVLGWLGDAAGTAASAVTQLVGILYEIVRIGATIAALSLLAPFAALLVFLKDPGKWINAGKDVIAGIGRGLMGAGNALIDPLREPVQNAIDFITSPSKWAKAGAGLVGAVASGITDKAGDVVGAVGDVAGKARSMLPFSDAEEGPLPDLSKSGGALVQTLVGGIQGEGGAVQNVLGGILGGAPIPGLGGAAAALGGGGPAVGGGAGAAAGGPITITLNQENSFEGVSADEDLEQRIEEATESGGQAGLEQLEKRLQRAVGLEGNDEGDGEEES
ncbi:tape-measure tail protein [Halobacterium phage ChaoS9]|uniref:Tape-measure tail protein n=1 Tax=Halobacterium phage ChaoS9 TaxID=2847105 RepID=A0A481V6T9_9CAUD|nr:tape-measure tail protein [Halobacterium phage ChaoS9]QBI90027.1 tape-measure tail protein [Halobacterium phage ChaoS9]